MSLTLMSDFSRILLYNPRKSSEKANYRNWRTSYGVGKKITYEKSYFADLLLVLHDRINTYL